VLRAGDPVMIQGIVNVSRPEGSEGTEGSEWYRIDLPDSVRVVWVAERFIDESQRVNAPILNVRSGPGTYYGTVIQLEIGTIIEPVQRQGDWLGIRPPEGSYAFVAAHLVSRQVNARNASSFGQRNYGPGGGASSGAFEDSVSRRDINRTNYGSPNSRSSSGGGSERSWLTPMRIRSESPEERPRRVVGPGELPAAGALPGFGEAGPVTQDINTSFSSPGTLIGISEEMFVPVEEGAEPDAGAAPSASRSLGGATSAYPSNPGAQRSDARGSLNFGRASEGSSNRSRPGSSNSETRQVLKREVTREGIVRRVTNPLAPSRYELVDRRSGRRIDFLENRQYKSDLAELVGQRVFVRGSELKDRYWNIPVLAIDRLNVYPDGGAD